MLKTPQNEAIIYIPSLGHNTDIQTVEQIAFRLQKAIDTNIDDASLKFKTDLKLIKYGFNDGLESNVAEVSTVGENSVPAFTIYELNFGKELVEQYSNSNILSKSVMLFAQLVAIFPKLIRSFFNNHGLGKGDKVQVFYVLGIFFLLSLYGVLLIVAFLTAIYQHNELLKGLPNPTEICTKYFYLPKLPFYLQFIINSVHGAMSYIFAIFHLIWDLINAYKKYIIGLTAALFISFGNLKNIITESAIDYLCAIYYFDTGDKRLNIKGKFEHLLEYVCETGYDKIHVYAYSFGSLIALDIFCPVDDQPSNRVKTKVDHLVTIGCPFDFIRAYWPYYFQERSNTAKGSLNISKWANVFSTSDILSSNFRDDGKKENGDKFSINGLYPENIPYDLISNNSNKFLDALMFNGLRAHKMYWDSKEYSTSCFNNIFIKLYKKDN